MCCMPCCLTLHHPLKTLDWWLLRSQVVSESCGNLLVFIFRSWHPPWKLDTVLTTCWLSSERYAKAIFCWAECDLSGVLFYNAPEHVLQNVPAYTTDELCMAGASRLTSWRCRVSDFSKSFSPIFRELSLSHLFDLLRWAGHMGIFKWHIRHCSNASVKLYPTSLWPWRFALICMAVLNCWYGCWTKNMGKPPKSIQSIHLFIGLEPL